MKEELVQKQGVPCAEASMETREGLWLVGLPDLFPCPAAQAGGYTSGEGPPAQLEGYSRAVT